MIAFGFVAGAVVVGSLTPTSREPAGVPMTGPTTRRPVFALGSPGPPAMTNFHLELPPAAMPKPETVEHIDFGSPFPPPADRPVDLIDYRYQPKISLEPFP